MRRSELTAVMVRGRGGTKTGRGFASCFGRNSIRFQTRNAWCHRVPGGGDLPSYRSSLIRVPLVSSKPLDVAKYVCNIACIPTSVCDRGIATC